MRADTYARMLGAHHELWAPSCAASEWCCCFALRQQGALWLFEKSQSPAPLSSPVASEAGLCLEKINSSKKKIYIYEKEVK